MQSKSIDLFLYNRDLRHERIRDSFSWGINLTPLHISRETNLKSIQLYTTVKQLIQST